MYKLVAIDLDGTLLNSNKEVSIENKTAIKGAIDLGVKVIICTGRIFAAARIYAKKIGITSPIIACNGAVIKEAHNSNTIFSLNIDPLKCAEVVNILKNEELYFHLYVNDTMYSERLAFTSFDYANKNDLLPKEDRIDIRVVEDLLSIIPSFDKYIYKIVAISSDKQKLNRARSLIKKIKDISVMSSNYDNFEVVHKSVSKGSALKLLASKLGIDSKEVISIGDNENDFSMIKYAGLGVAMGNAEQMIKDIADYIAPTNDENGVKYVFDKYIFT